MLGYFSCPIREKDFFGKIWYQTIEGIFVLVIASSLLSKPTNVPSASLKGTGSQFSECPLIKLLLSNLFLILSVNNPTHMYLSDLRVYFKVELYSE